MSGAYTPTLVVAERTRIEKVRELPLPGKVLVSVGETVQANTAVLSAQLPGDVTVVQVANQMGFDPADVAEAIRVKKGEGIETGALIARIETFFGLFASEVQSPVTGIVEYYTEANAHLGIRLPPIPLSIDAYIGGRVTAIEEGKAVTIETEASLIQGVFGVGGERHGEIFVLPVSPNAIVLADDLRALRAEFRGKVLVGSSQFSIDALNYAAEQGAACVVMGSFDSNTLTSYLGYELGVSVTGDEKVPMTVIITEGFGKLPMSPRILELAKDCEGQMASVNGATQVRAGAMRPEVIIARDFSGMGAARQSVTVQTLAPKSRVRIIRIPHFGEFGVISEMPFDPQKIETGAKVRVLKVKLDGGEEIVVPRANVELV